MKLFPATLFFAALFSFTSVVSSKTGTLADYENYGGVSNFCIQAIKHNVLVYIPDFVKHCSTVEGYSTKIEDYKNKYTITPAYYLDNYVEFCRGAADDFNLDEFQLAVYCQHIKLSGTTVNSFLLKTASYNGLRGICSTESNELRLDSGLQTATPDECSSVAKAAYQKLSLDTRNELLDEVFLVYMTQLNGEDTGFFADTPWEDSLEMLESWLTQQDSSENIARSLKSVVSKEYISVGACFEQDSPKLDANQNKAIRYLIRGRKGRDKSILCISNIEVEDTIEIRGETVVSYVATLVYPKGRKSSCDPNARICLVTDSGKAIKPGAIVKYSGEDTI